MYFGVRGLYICYNYYYYYYYYFYCYCYNHYLAYVQDTLAKTTFNGKMSSETLKQFEPNFAVNDLERFTTYNAACALPSFANGATIKWKKKERKRNPFLWVDPLKRKASAFPREWVPFKGETSPLRLAYSGYIFRGDNFCLPSEKRSTLKGNYLLPKDAILPFKNRLLSRMSLATRAQLFKANDIVS